MNDFVASDLVAPFVDNGHVDVVDEDGHLLPRWRPVRRPDSLVHKTFNRFLS